MEDWGLQAIVKGCNGIPIGSSTTAATTRLMEDSNWYSFLRSDQEEDEFFSSCVYNSSYNNPQISSSSIFHDEFEGLFGRNSSNNSAAASISHLLRDFKEPADQKLHHKNQIIQPTKQKQRYILTLLSFNSN